MTTLRRTSTYLVQIQTADPSTLVSEMVERCPAEVNGSGVNGIMAQVRFRCKTDDPTALHIALQIADGRQFRLTTGYGINEREVAQ